MGDDATIGAPAAESTLELNSHEAEADADAPPTVATVWVARGGRWVEYTLPADEVMEIELPNGETGAIVKTEELDVDEDEWDGHPDLEDYDVKYDLTD